MTELMRNAWLGWLRFTDSGKLAAVLFAALLYLWLSGKWKRKKSLFLYTALMSLMCILPVTAMAFMLYQTRFYDYEWIWSLVPMTVVAAWGITELLGELWKDFSLSQWKRALPVTALIMAGLALCSGLGGNGFDRKAKQYERQHATEVLAQVRELQGGDICLWAPREILEYARETTGSVQVLYGRNMWDESLNAYAYDTYSRELTELYLWMENVEPSGTAQVEDAQQGELWIEGESCVTAAAEAGVNCILLPGSLEEGAAEKLAKVLGGSAVRLDEYYLLTR